MPFKRCSPASHSLARECEGVVITWARFPSSGISPGKTGNSSSRNIFQMKVQFREEMQPPPVAQAIRTEYKDVRRRRARWAGHRAGAAWGFFPFLLVPLVWGVGGRLKRSRSRRLGWEKEGREHAVTIRTGCAWSLSLWRSGFLLSQCFLTHFLSSQSDIYLTLQLLCTEDAKFGGCRHSPCCRVYTWRLTRAAHTHEQPLGTHTLVQGDTQCVCRDSTSILVYGSMGRQEAQAPTSTSASVAVSWHRHCSDRPIVRVKPT